MIIAKQHNTNLIFMVSPLRTDPDSRLCAIGSNLFAGFHIELRFL